MRTPNEVYLGLPVTSVDGGQLLYRTRWGGTKITVQPTVGQADTEVFFDGGAAGAFAGGVLTRDVRSLNLTAESGAWTWRFGQTVLDAHLAWRGGIVLPADSFKYTFTNVGLTYDNGALLVMAELMDGKTSNGRFDTRGFYTSTGYRLGAWMPYVTHARVAHRGSVVGANPPSVTQAIGLRWDAWKDIALKAQAERSRLSGQQFINTGAGVDRHRSVNVYTFSVDFVF